MIDSNAGRGQKRRAKEAAAITLLAWEDARERGL